MNWHAKKIFGSLVDEDYKRIRMTVAPDPITKEQCQAVARKVMEWVLKVQRDGFETESDRQNPGVTVKIWLVWLEMRRKQK